MVLTNGTGVPCDVVVVGIGVIPNIEWLEGSGIETDRAVLCDQYMRTSLPDVYALGDLASWYNRASAGGCGWSTGPTRSNRRRWWPVTSSPTTTQLLTLAFPTSGRTSTVTDSSW